uniref:Galactosyltransferase N-terminal domain-containing protein n=1 Tax=Knipowitschia caucasica TaxID=637954 RepID=A0AAV2L6L9_KNICA
MHGSLVAASWHAKRTQGLPDCPETPPDLKGPLRVEFNFEVKLDDLKKQYNQTLQEGGRYKPPTCNSKHKVAVIISFRNRPDMVTGKYKMIRHNRDKHNEANSQNPGKLSQTKNTMDKDGMNTLTYTVKKIEKNVLYTFITVDIQAPMN